MVRSFVEAGRPAVWMEFLRRYGRPSNSSSSLWAAFTLTVHINALYSIMNVYMERKNMQLGLLRFRSRVYAWIVFTAYVR